MPWSQQDGRRDFGKSANPERGCEGDLSQPGSRELAPPEAQPSTALDTQQQSSCCGLFFQHSDKAIPDGTGQERCQECGTAIPLAQDLGHHPTHCPGYPALDYIGCKYIFMYLCLYILWILYIYFISIWYIFLFLFLLIFIVTVIFLFLFLFLLVFLLIFVFTVIFIFIFIATVIFIVIVIAIVIVIVKVSYSYMYTNMYMYMHLYIAILLY